VHLPHRRQRPPVRARRAEHPVTGGVDARDGAAQPHRTAPRRAHGAVQPVSSSGRAGQDGDHLDQISDGRLELGIGSGSIEDEHLRTGLPWGSFRERSGRLGETLAILRQPGRRLRWPPLRGARHADRPRSGPVQRPRPPIVVGGVGEKYTLPLVARLADVWNVPTYALGELEHKVTVLRSICAEIGRDPAEIVLSVEAVMALAPDQAPTAQGRRSRRTAVRRPRLGAPRGRAGRHAGPDRAVHPRPGVRRDA
jgi:alkanesulfonate monooxygenase SsuD/methylene tetrahydromethanopterin reductase-like flavin-dependent oxidoreductase (luciferase family)